ncbi:MAG: DNA mismatch repair endonuclease MutL [Parachlamydia sp.]|nr:DNA mismatch repair endonuclease MutL [Parachlamydia sp.]
MPTKIRVLNDHTINKIAAGEVIENPASVVKELVENAMDAGSTEICVEIQLGGRQLIRITDNGSGMSQDDALLCLERHATSKIKEVEDIQSLLTMGFRGEALPSIAAVSKFSLLTCPQEETSLKGTLILVEGGSILSAKPAVRSPGTTIEVKSLFYNVPVRRKFQRSPAFDVQEVVKIMSALAMGHPALQFELISDQKLLFKTSASDKPFQEQLLEKIETLHGKETARLLTPVQFECAPFQIEGFIGNPSLHKPNKTGQFLFINQRAVQSPLVGSAVREGYGTMLGNHRYPVFYLHLTLPGSLLDVNVHPQKKEVRLREGAKIKETIIQGIQKALKKEGSIFDFMEQPSFSAYPPIRFPEKTVNETPWHYQTTSPTPLLRREAQADRSSTLIAPLSTVPRAIAALVNYLVIDTQNLPPEIPISLDEQEGLCLMDNQAAYARIFYENLLQEEERIPSMQSLLIPAAVPFTPADAVLIQECLPLLLKMGFSLREFGANTFLIDALPPSFAQDQLEDTMQAFLEAYREGGKLAEQEREKRLAQAACKAAFPRGKKLLLYEGEQLLKELWKCTIKTRCPRGRAIFCCISQEALSKYF